MKSVKIIVLSIGTFVYMSACSPSHFVDNLKVKLADQGMVGTWQVSLGNDYVGDEFIRIFITPNGDFYIADDNLFEEKTVVKIPVQKISNEWSIPKDLEVIEYFSGY